MDHALPPPFRYAHAVEIAAPLDAVWAYAGDSGRAGEWSVYFDHISLLPESPVPDGQVGALRRCYRRADETGVTWDEEVMSLVPKQYREIRTYNLQGFRLALQAGAAFTEYRVGQHYEALDEERTRLSFSTDLRRPDLSLARWIFGRTAPEVVRIFRVNLENIRAAVEAAHRGGDYVRPHAYEPTNPNDG